MIGSPRRLVRTGVAVAAAVMFLVAASASVALVAAMPGLRARPTTVTAGTRLTLLGSSFKAGELVKFYVGPPRAGADYWGSTRADSTGGFRKTFDVNPAVGTGDWVVIACQRSCMVKASASFRTRPASTSASRLVGIRAAHHPGYDRIVFQFSGAVPSRRNVRYVSRLVADPSGRIVRTAGRAILEVSFFRATARNLAGRLTAPDRISFALPNVMNAVQAGDFESVLSYGIGLAGRTSFHVFTLTNPSRVVIDIPTPFRTVLKRVYFYNPRRFASNRPPFVTSVLRPVLPGTPATGVMDRLFAGPTGSEYARGVRLLQSGAMGFTGLSISGGIARVRLTGRCSSGGSTISIAQEIVPTLKQFSTVRFVKIYDPAGHTEHPTGLRDSIPFCLEP